MKLTQWVEEQIRDAGARGESLSKKAVLKALAERAAVSVMTLAPVERGAKMGNYEKARAISKATSWKVTIPELCDDQPCEVIEALITEYQRCQP
jgi:transcriptional regulator with XRE-family HTH domain